MKKYISILVIMILLLGLCACDVSIKGEEGHMSEAFSIDEALEYISTHQPEKTTLEDTGLLASARDRDSTLFGFVNVKGEWVVTPRYPSTVSFEGDYGLILNSYSAYEYMDRSGRVVYSTYGKNPISESNHFSDGMLALSLANDSLQRYVYLDVNFVTAVTASGLPSVDWRWYSSSGLFGMATPFRDGYAVVMRQRNANCYDGLAGESAYVIDKKGTILSTLPAGLDADPSGVDNNGNIIMKTTSNLYGLYSKSGTELIECKYRFLKHNDGSLYLACNDKGFWGYVDQNGETVVPFQYQKALPFSEGLAAVYDGQFWGFINETGELAIESVFDDVAAFSYSNPDVSGNKGAFCESRAAVKKNGYWIIIDTGEFPYACLTAEQCEGIEDCPFIGIRNGIIIYKENVEGNILYGAMTASGKIVIEPTFIYLDLFN